MDRLRKIIFRVLNFCRDNALPLASLVISLASLSIAWMGLNLTITAQREDREHKELLLRPVLNLTVRVKDFSVSLINSGLGPALITDTTYYIDGGCTVVSTNNIDKFSKNDLSVAIRKLSPLFTQPFHSTVSTGEWKLTPELESALPLPSQIIGVGQTFDLFKFQPEFLAVLKSKLSELPNQRRDIINDEFIRQAQSIPIGIRYCSMSRHYCDRSVQHTGPCPLP